MVSDWLRVHEKCNLLSVVLSEAFDLLSYQNRELRQARECDVLSWVQWTEDLLNGNRDFVYDILATSVQ